MTRAKARRATTRCLWHEVGKDVAVTIDGEAAQTLASAGKGWERIALAHAITHVRAGATISRVWRYTAVDGAKVVDTRGAVSMVDALAGEGRAVIGRVLRRVAAG